MTTVSMAPAVREGFTTVTPYIRVGKEGLVDFLVQVFDAQETFSGRGGGGGMHRELRIGDSMLMIGEGGADAAGVMPIRPVAFHVFVKDVDATLARDCGWRDGAWRALRPPLRRTRRVRQRSVREPLVHCHAARPAVARE